MKPQDALTRVIEHREIFHDEMTSLMRQIMGGEVSPVMTAAILAGLRVKKETVGEIAAAAQVMREHLQEEGVIQFLLKSFVDGDWRFNVPVLWDQYPHIVGWETIPAWPHPTQFIPGGNSPYVTDAYRDALLAQFPQARAHVIAGAGHWVHAEKPEAVLRAIRRYLTSIAA